MARLQKESNPKPLSAFRRLVLGLAPDPFDEGFSGVLGACTSSKKICESNCFWPPNNALNQRFQDASALDCINRERGPPGSIKAEAVPQSGSQISPSAVLTLAALITAFTKLCKTTLDMECLDAYLDRFRLHLKCFSEPCLDVSGLDLRLTLPELEHAGLLRGIYELSCSDKPALHSLELLRPPSEAMDFIRSCDSSLAAFILSWDEYVV